MILFWTFSQNIKTYAVVIVCLTLRSFMAGFCKQLLISELSETSSAFVD